MNENMSFKVCVKFGVPVYMGRIFLDTLYELGGKSAKTELQIM